MKRAILFSLLLALLIPTVALADAGTEAWEMAYDLFMRQLNDDMERNGAADRVYTDATVVEGDYQVFFCADGSYAIARPSDDFSSIRQLEIYAEDPAAFSRRLDDVAYLAYALGSRDSVEAVDNWRDRWRDKLVKAAKNHRTLEADPCECAAFIAFAGVAQNDGGAYVLRIFLSM